MRHFSSDFNLSVIELFCENNNFIEEGRCTRAAISMGRNF